MGQPHGLGDAFHLPLSHGPPPSHPSFFAGRPNGLWGVGSRSFEISPGVKAVKGEAQGERSGSFWGVGSWLRRRRRTTPGFCGWTHPLRARGRRPIGARGSGGACGVAGPRKWLTAPPPPPPPSPPPSPSAQVSSYNLEVRHVQNFSFPQAGRHFGYRVLQVGDW